MTWALSMAGMTLGIAMLPELRVAGIELVAVRRMVEPAAIAPTVLASPDAAAVTAVRPESAEASGAPTPPLEWARFTRDHRARLAARQSRPCPSLSVIARKRNKTETTATETQASLEWPATIVEMVSTLVLDPWMAALAGTAAITWVLGTSLLLVRLAVAHVNLMRLRRTAYPRWPNSNSFAGRWPKRWGSGRPRCW